MKPAIFVVVSGSELELHLAPLHEALSIDLSQFTRHSAICNLCALTVYLVWPPWPGAQVWCVRQSGLYQHFVLSHLQFHTWTKTFFLVIRHPYFVIISRSRKIIWSCTYLAKWCHEFMSRAFLLPDVSFIAWLSFCINFWNLVFFNVRNRSFLV